jgi:hypothetical protein
MKYSPIVLFLYNRPEHTKLTLDALANNIEASESELFIYCDGLKPNSSENDQDKIKAVRQIANEENRFKKVNVICRNENLGLANSIISGVTEIVNRFDRIIVLEDDIVVSPFFLKYMNYALDYYQDNDKIASIHGYSFPINNLPDFYFLKGTDCWGWATWKRAWNYFEADGTVLFDKLIKSNKGFDFNFYNSYDFLGMLSDQIQNKNDSWAIRWYASAYLKDMLTLFPGKTFVSNIGFDGSGTHSDSNDYYENNDLNDLKTFNFDTLHIEESTSAKIKISKFNKKVIKTNIVLRVLYKIKRLLFNFFN